MARRKSRNNRSNKNQVKKNTLAQAQRNIKRDLGTVVTKSSKYKTNYVNPYDDVLETLSRRSRIVRAASLERRKREKKKNSTTTTFFHTPLRGVAALPPGGDQKGRKQRVSDTQLKKMPDCVQRPDPNGGGSQSKLKKGSEKKPRQFVKWC